jgi:molecular chaperone GrpE
MSAEHEQQATQAPVEEAGAAEPQPPAEERLDGVHATADPPEDDAAVDVEHDLDELLARAGKADEYLALAQRTQADFENYRKRVAREAAAAQERGVASLAKELLPALDNLGRALAAAEAEGEADGHLGTGVKLVQDELLAVLKRVGIEPFSPRGERFDPNQHEAMAQQAVEGADAGTVVEVYQQGFRQGESVLRPARVVVAA